MDFNQKQTNPFMTQVAGGKQRPGGLLGGMAQQPGMVGTGGGAQTPWAPPQDAAPAQPFTTPGTAPGNPAAPAPGNPAVPEPGGAGLNQPVEPQLSGLTGGEVGSQLDPTNNGGLPLAPGTPGMTAPPVAGSPGSGALQPPTFTGDLPGSQVPVAGGVPGTQPGHGPAGGGFAGPGDAFSPAPSTPAVPPAGAAGALTPGWAPGANPQAGLLGGLQTVTGNGPAASGADSSQRPGLAQFLMSGGR